MNKEQCRFCRKATSPIGRGVSREQWTTHVYCYEYLVCFEKTESCVNYDPVYTEDEIDEMLFIEHQYATDEYL